MADPHDTTKAPKRQSARCPICHGVQHIKRDGTFGKHHLWHGHDYFGVCPGAGRTPEGRP